MQMIFLLNVDVVKKITTANIYISFNKNGRVSRGWGRPPSVNNILKDYNNPSGHIFNLGTGITPDIHPDKVKYLIDVLADVSPQYNVK